MRNKYPGEDTEEHRGTPIQQQSSRRNTRFLALTHLQILIFLKEMFLLLVKCFCGTYDDSIFLMIEATAWPIKIDNIKPHSCHSKYITLFFSFMRITRTVIIRTLSKETETLIHS